VALQCHSIICLTIDLKRVKADEIVAHSSNVYVVISRLWLYRKALGGDATLRVGSSKAEPIISPRRRPLSGGAGRPKFNQLEMVTTFTYKPSLVKIDGRNFELSW